MSIELLREEAWKDPQAMRRRWISLGFPAEFEEKMWAVARKEAIGKRFSNVTIEDMRQALREAGHLQCGPLWVWPEVDPELAADDDDDDDE